MRDAAPAPAPPGPRGRSSNSQPPAPLSGGPGCKWARPTGPDGLASVNGNGGNVRRWCARNSFSFYIFFVCVFLYCIHQEHTQEHPSSNLYISKHSFAFFGGFGLIFYHCVPILSIGFFWDFFPFFIHMSCPTHPAQNVPPPFPPAHTFFLHLVFDFRPCHRLQRRILGKPLNGSRATKDADQADRTWCVVRSTFHSILN